MTKWRERTATVGTALLAAPRSWQSVFPRAAALAPGHIAWATRRGSPSFYSLSCTAAALPLGAAVAVGIQKWRPDWIHAHFAGVASTAAWITHRLTGVPFSFTPHAADIFDAAYGDRGLRDKLRAAAFTVAISAYTQRHLAGLSGITEENVTNRLPLIKCGLEEEYFALPPAAKHAKGREFLVCSVGRLVEKKGHGFLLEALAVLRGRGVPIRGVIIGDGPLHQHLIERRAALQLESLVEFRGAGSAADVRRLLDEADAFCLPCIITEAGDREGLPNALLEAMARGTPVVSTTVPGVDELIEHDRNGLLVEPRAVVKLADALGRLIEDGSLRAHLAKQAHETVRSQHCLTVQARMLAERIEQGLADTARTDPRT